MRFRIIALSLVAIAGITVPLAISPAPASAIVRTADDPTPNPGGWSESAFNSYIKKMTQPADPTKPRKFYPLTPSQSKFRAFMVSSLGSVLGAATPDKWQREQMANDNKYNHSWEKFEQDFASKTAAGAPSTWDEYTLQKADWKSKNQDKVPKNSPPPATKTNTLRKGINKFGTAALGLTAIPIGFQLGQGITEMFGFEATEGQVCTLDPNPLNIGIEIVSGMDCDAWAMTEAAKLQANTDVVSGVTGGTICSKVTPAWCATLTGVFDQVATANVANRYSTGNNVRWVCFSVTGDFPQMKTASGKIVANASPNGTDWGGITGKPGACASPKVGFVWNLTTSTKTYDPMVEYGFNLGAANEAKEVPVTTNADPNRAATCTILGTNGIEYSNTQSATYQESSGRVAGPDCPELPPGVVAANIKANDGQGNDTWNEPTTQPYRDWATQNPSCTDGSCPLDLLIWDIEHSSIASCFDLGQGCHGWMESPDRDTRFECRYGGKKVDLKECYVYSGVFSEQRVQIGSPYSDPETGVWSAGQSSPSAARAGMAQPVQNPEQVRDCFQDGWSEFNPVEWVFTPIKCSFEWAFVPRPSVVQLSGVTASTVLADKAPGQLATIAGSWQFNPSMSGCRKDVTYPSMFPGVPPKVVTLWNACAGGQQEQLALWSRWIVSAGMVLLVYMVLKRSVAGTVDYRA